MYCRNCGKQIDDNAVLCVNCGVPTRKFNLLQQEMNVVQEKKVNGLGVAGFVIGMISGFPLFLIFICLILAGAAYGINLFIIGASFFIISAVGVVLSGVGMGVAKKYKQSGLALIGLIFAILGCMAWLFVGFLGILAVI